MFSQGFKQAEIIAGKVVLLFRLCLEQFSKQPHYDFGLRALKSVLVNAGSLKRELRDREEVREELPIIVQSVVETIMPKLVFDDIGLFEALISGVFPGSSTDALVNNKMKDTIKSLCKKYGYVYASDWVAKNFTSIPSSMYEAWGDASWPYWKWKNVRLANHFGGNGNSRWYKGGVLRN